MTLEKVLGEFIEKKLSELKQQSKTGSSIYYTNQIVETEKKIAQIVSEHSGRHMKQESISENLYYFKNHLNLETTKWSESLKIFTSYTWEKEISKEVLPKLDKKQLARLGNIYSDHILNSSKSMRSYGADATIDIWFKIEKTVDLSQKQDAWKIIEVALTRRYRKGSKINLKILKTLCYLKTPESQLKTFIENKAKADPIFEKNYPKILEKFSISLDEEKITFQPEKKKIYKTEVHLEIGYLIQTHQFSKADAELLLESFFKVLCDEYNIIHKSDLDTKNIAIIRGNSIQELDDNTNLFNKKMQLLLDSLDHLKGGKPDAKYQMVKTAIAMTSLTQSIQQQPASPKAVKKNKL